jgi:thiol-disulfide isomerase/thioredoxin
MINAAYFRILIFSLLASLGVSGQTSVNDVAGEWRGEFVIQDTIKVPFNFEIDESGKVVLLNAAERFQSGTIKLKKDSLFIPLDEFDNELALSIHKNGDLSGTLRKQNQVGLNIPVTATKGTSRFEQKTPPAKDISGRYDVEFELGHGKKQRSVAIFKQQGTKLTGTFLKPSGDARYLEGTVDGERFFLSSFIGSTPGYYEGTVDTNGKISGFQAGTKIKYPFSGRFDPTAQLEDPFTLSQLKAGRTSLDFSLPDMSGNRISPGDKSFQGKALIIAITGTWCPNCIDEAAFLAPWYKENKKRGVEIITIHYERQTDTAFAHKVMRRFRNRFNIEYTQVFGGYATGDSVLASLPTLATFKAFPTTIFIGKDGKVSKIHTGFSGPATGKFYDDFVKEFNEEVDRLLAQ